MKLSSIFSRIFSAAAILRFQGKCPADGRKRRKNGMGRRIDHQRMTEGYEQTRPEAASIRRGTIYFLG